MVVVCGLTSGDDMIRVGDITPWFLYEGGRKPSDGELTLAWNAFKARDFIFGIKWDRVDESTIVVIVPELYWTKEHKMFHDSIPVVVQYLPNNLLETVPCVYETEDNVEYTKNLLMNIGFVYNSKIDEYMDKQLFTLSK
jgi:hypothetical protein